MKLLRGYSYLVYTRRLLLRKQKSLKKPVISVGNIAFGGTGKTPLVEGIARELMEMGLKVSILSRGYKRKSKGMVVVSDGEGLVSSPQESGEEPFMLAWLLGKAVVIVDKDRVKAGTFAEEELGVDIHILDDGFQYLKLYRDLDIVCLPARFPTSHGWLREPVRALGYADMAVFTGRSRGTTVEQWRTYLHATFPGLQALHLPSIFKGFYNAENRPMDREWVLDNRWVAVSGIARPHRFLRMLREKKVQIAGVFTFPDHHWPKERDVERVKSFIERYNLKGIVTTDKDVLKWQGLPCEVVTMRVGYPPLPNLLIEQIRKFRPDGS